MKLANNKLATVFAALVIACSSVAPASATVNKNYKRQVCSNTGEKSIAVIFDEIWTSGWEVPSLPDAHNTTSSSPYRARNQSSLPIQQQTKRCI